MFEGVAKLFQRQIYSWLSSRCGLPICIVGVLLAIISAFQFGEVFLEWSKERYTARFSVYGDNIGGRSYERYMCPELPVDIVYTWVNGSDPNLIAELRALHRKMARKSSHSANGATNSSEANDTFAEPMPIGKCPFKNCVPWSCVILDGRNHPELTLETLRSFSPLLGTAWDSQYINSTGNYMTPVYTVRMPSEEDVSGVLKGIIRDSEGRNIPATRGFLTTQGHQLGAMKTMVAMVDFAILTSDGFGLANNSGLIRRWSQIQFKRNVSEAAVKAHGIAVVGFKPGVLQHILKRNKTYHFSGEPVKVHQAYLIWIPFALPYSENNTENKIEGDIISDNRFQDNEELRYSLRSVEQHAPWVRHIFIVTNGQIPSWLNLDAPRVTLVTHKEIFLNYSHLPTYSSPAIESHLHRIPGLSKRFIYLNDDVMFGADVWPGDFYTPQKGQKVFLSWPVPHCAEGCPPNWIRDHYCDTACNNSACDWDAGDCANATRPGWQPGHFWHRSDRGNMDYCNSGCINSWLGDRYCDMSCRVADCGYDAGDCGTEHWEELYSIQVDSNGGNYTVPLETKAMYFNLTSLFFNGTISSAEYTPSPLIRTAVVAQRFKTLSITFNKNITRSTTNISVAGSDINGTKLTVSFNLTGDTASKNKTVVQKTNYVPHWSFPNFTDTQSWQFLRTVAVKIQNANHSIKYWVTERASPSNTPPPPTTYTNYTVANISALSENVSQALKSLEQEYREGDLTEKGYLKRKFHLLEPFRHLLVDVNGTKEGGSNQTTPTVATEPGVKGGGRGEGDGGEGDTVNGRRSLSHVELFDAVRGRGVGGRRRLMVYGEVGVSDEELEMAEWVARGKQKELTWEEDLQRAVHDWERNHGPWDPRHTPWESRRRLPWEKYRVFPEAAGADDYTTNPHIGRRLMDTFGDSLRHVNRLYTKAYGNQARKVPAHMPHMINQEVMRALHERYPEEFDRTSSNKIRSSDDMQFSFSYFYFLMEERQKMDLDKAFLQLDTDKSGILSVRELRTLLAKISDLPIDLKTVHNFEDLLRKCDREYNGTRPSVDPIEFETHYDPDLPLVTLDFTRHCKPLLEKLNSTFKSKPMYRHEEVGEEEVTFKMISENASKVMQQLDEIRRDRKKFICLNDNIDHQKEGAELAKLILLDFYESLYPTPSQFELSPQYRNRFLHTSELNDWLVFRGQIQTVLHVACALLLVMCVVALFYGKIMQLKRRLSRLVASLLHMERTRTPTV